MREHIMSRLLQLQALRERIDDEIRREEKRVKRITDLSTRIRTMPHVTTAEVRAWALANGYEIGTRGRIPNEVLAAYREAAADLLP